jgi:hypothetical protein
MPVFLSLLLACGDRADDPVSSEESTDSSLSMVPTGDTGGARTSQTGHTGATANTGDTGAPLATYDCSAIPPLTSTEVLLDAPRGYNDVVFDVDGAMIGSNESSLIRATDAKTAAVWLPGIGQAYKFDRLPGGDIVLSRSAGEGGGVLRLTSSGGRTLLASGLLTHGLAVGPDGFLWVATNYTAGAEGLFRIDPDTGEAELVVDASMAPPRDIAFHPDGDRLYWGTLSGGEIWAIDVDLTTGLPSGIPEQVARVPEAWHDTVEVDACGNLYVGSVFESAIYRVFTDGTVELLIDWDFNSYGHGLSWGDPAGGWDEQAIYITHPYVGSRVTELHLGVPGAKWEGEALNAGRL